MRYGLENPQAAILQTQNRILPAMIEDEYDKHRIKAIAIGGLFLYSFLLHADIAYFSALSAIAIVVLMICKPILGVPFFVATVVLAPDRPVSVLSGATLVEHSIFLDTVGGFTYISLIVFFVAFLVGMYVIKDKIPLQKGVIIAFAIPFLLPFYGFLTTDDMRKCISDSRYFLAPFAVFGVLALSKFSYQKLLWLLNWCLVAKCVTMLFVAFTGGGISLVYWGTTGYFMPLILLLNIDRNTAHNIILTIIVLISLLIYPARGRLMVLGLALIVVFFHGKNTHRIALGVLILLIVTSALPWLAKNYGAVHRYFTWKITTVNIFDPTSHSSSMRKDEFMNIGYEAITKIYPFFVGEGYGGYFVDNYKQFDYAEISGGGAFRDEWIHKRAFYDPHTNINFMMLKSGVVFTAIFFGGIMYFAFIKRYKVPKQLRLALFFLPVIAVAMQSIKISLIFGMFIYLLNEALEITMEKSQKPLGNVGR